MSRTFYRLRRFWRISPTAFVFFVLSFLNLITPTNSTVWMATVITKEYGHFFAVFGVLLAIQLWRRGMRRRAGVLLIPIVIFLGPLWDAYSLEATWKKELQQGLQLEQEPASLISLKTLFFGYGEPRIKPRRMIYHRTERYELALDFYPSPVEGPRPWVVVVHGGGWTNGDSGQLPELNSILAAQGYSVAAINYSLLPNGRWPAQKAEVEAAVDFLKAEAGALNLDPSRYFLLGRSAGGQIAGVAAYSSKDPALKGLILYYAPTDMISGYWFGEEIDIVTSRPLMRNFLGGGPEEKADVYREASPVAHVREGSVPTLLFYGKPDMLVWFKHGEILNARLAQNKVPHAFILFSWAAHGFDYNLRGPAGQVSTRAVEYFLNALSK